MRQYVSLGPVVSNVAVGLLRVIQAEISRATEPARACVASCLPGLRDRIGARTLAVNLERGTRNDFERAACC